MVFVHHVQLPGLHPATLGFDAGVSVFFVLSGYLMYGSLLNGAARPRRADLVGYAVRRLMRIAPAYLIAAFGIALWRYPDLLKDPIGLASTMRTSIVVVWTLQIEVAYYVLLPAAFLVLRRLDTSDRVRWLTAGAASSIFATVLVMVVSSRILGYIPGQLVTTIASFAWAFVPGMIVAELEHRRRLADPLPVGVVVLGVVLIGLSVAVNLPSNLDLATAIGAALIVAFIVSRPAGTRIDRVYLAVGAISYSAYLWHAAIIDAVDRPTPTWAGAVLAVLMTVLVSSAVYMLVERPFNRLARSLTLRLDRRTPATDVERDVPAVPTALAPVHVETLGGPR